ncbi:hypothetical protein [Acinetobacter oleivorans]|uniref:hypothetical protein n=1 Tax=Acinetobacter oleivorans TaxID=1148157 RepID=UPI003A8B7A80
MNKNELDFEKMKLATKARVTELKFKTFNTFMLFVTIGVCFYLLMQGLEEMVKSDSQALEALSKVVEKLNFAGITSYLVGILGVGYGLYERKTRKKLNN